MKIILTILLLAASFSANAVDVTLTFNASQASRVAEACGVALGLRDGNGASIPCNLAQSKTFLINVLRQAVTEYERAKAAAAVTIEPFDPQ